MKLSYTVVELLSLIFQNLKRLRDSGHAPFRDNLPCVGWDLLWSICTPTWSVYGKLQRRTESQRQM